MADAVRQFLARPLVDLWLATSPESWRRRVVPADSPHVHAAGTDPDRVLVAGDGAATGRGVLTHDLGLPGYLARSLSAHTGRAVDVDIVVTGGMTARTCLEALSHVTLGRFDVIVLSVGANEALGFLGETQWGEALESLLRYLDEKSAPHAEVFVLPVPFFGINPHFPAALARTVDRHVQKLNAVTLQALDGRDRMHLTSVAQASAFEPEGPHVYQRWAEPIAAQISAALKPNRPRAGDTTVADEAHRQRALEVMGALRSGTDPVLDELTETARRAFGTSIAAVTLIASDSQLMKSAVGMEPIELPRQEAFCDITIRRSAHFVIEDASLDSRFADYSIVAGDPGIRFYAGYPIESPDGERIGALCLMDTEPRHFTMRDAELLRTLARGIQSHLWSRV